MSIFERKKRYFLQFSHFWHKMAIFQFLAKDFQLFFFIFFKNGHFPIFGPKRPKKERKKGVFFPFSQFWHKMAIFQFLAKNTFFSFQKWPFSHFGPRRPQKRVFLKFSHFWHKMAIFQFQAKKYPFFSSKMAFFPKEPKIQFL